MYKISHCGSPSLLQGNSVPPYLDIRNLFEINKMIENFKEYQQKRINNIHWISECKSPERRFSYVYWEKWDLGRP
jgi:hypothetical protein